MTFYYIDLEFVAIILSFDELGLKCLNTYANSWMPIQFYRLEYGSSILAP